MQKKVKGILMFIITTIVLVFLLILFSDFSEESCEFYSAEKKLACKLQQKIKLKT